MLNRRTFLKIGGVAGAGLLTPGSEQFLGVRNAVASLEVPQIPLAGKTIPKFTDPLPNYATLGRVDGTKALTVAMAEFQQKVLPGDYYASLTAPFNAGTYVWGYQISEEGGRTFDPFYPAFTIVAKRFTPTTITYVNNLPAFPLLQQYLTVDQTIHWSDPLGSMASKPKVPFSGPVPTVAHLHGAEVPSECDGGPNQWFTPNGLHGGGYSSSVPGLSNSAVFVYPNGQQATSLWFHDHALGITRLNVYAGLAGFYFIRDDRDSGTGNPINLPSDPYEVELLLQDRQFDTNGQWLFPDGYPAGLNGPPPNPSIHPYWIPEFFGDVIVVNGKAWPYLEVEPRRYRLRLVNASNARFFSLNLGPALPFWQIGTDGGFLDAPVRVSQLFIAPGERADVIVDFALAAGQTLVMTNSAKAPYPKGAPPDPQTAGQVMQFRVGSTITGGVDTSFDPSGPKVPLRTAPIVRLASDGSLTVTPQVRRQLALVEIEGNGGPEIVLLNNTHWNGKRPGAAASGQADPIPGFSFDGHDNYLSELPQKGSTEQWEIINLTGDAHPIHVHLVQFQLINRQAFNVQQYSELYYSMFPGGTFDGVDYAPGVFIPAFGPPADYGTPNAAGALGGNPDVSPFLQGLPQPPDPNEVGWKDTFKMFPGTVTRVVIRFAPQDLEAGTTTAGTNYYSFDPTSGPGYVWHCHILDHEDNEMMRPYNLT